jgi:hypothetical protein
MPATADAKPLSTCPVNRRPGTPSSRLAAAARFAPSPVLAEMEPLEARRDSGVQSGPAWPDRVTIGSPPLRGNLEYR